MKVVPKPVVSQAHCILSHALRKGLLGEIFLLKNYSPVCVFWKVSALKMQLGKVVYLKCSYLIYYKWKWLVCWLLC